MSKKNYSFVLFFVNNKTTNYKKYKGEYIKIKGDAHYILKENISKSRLLNKWSRLRNVKVFGLGKHSS